MKINQPNQQRTLSWITLFATTGTLVCCALPILLVTLGLGAVVASLTTSIPLLVLLAEYKPWMFGVSGLLLAITAWLLWIRPQQCPSDPMLAKLCDRSKVWNRRVLWSALVIWCIGFTAAYLLLPIRNLFEM